MGSPSRTEAARGPKASRSNVFAAADEILKGGRRPTVEALKLRLGGGSPNSILAYLGEWYAELGDRLERADTPAEGLMPELHRAALMLQRAALRPDGPADDATEVLIRSMRAEVLSLKTLLDELRAQRARDHQLLADARAMLLRREEALQESAQNELSLQGALAVARDRLRRSRGQARRSVKPSRSSPQRRSVKSPRSAEGARQRGRNAGVQQRVSSSTRTNKVRRKSARRRQRAQ